jgi:hypothetical protein
LTPAFAGQALEKFFDRVNHDQPMGLVAKRVCDKHVLRDRVPGQSDDRAAPFLIQMDRNEIDRSLRVNLAVKVAIR